MKQLRNFKGGDKYNGKNPEMEPIMKDAMSKYGGMNEDALINQLLNQVRTSKANGTYNPAQMQEYIKILKPHINSVQFEKLKNIINLINNEEIR